ncbi:hypothetical protein [Clostridium beijerinckii]|jgi:hypothetical protein|uniref:Uncharacterized protein n=1 Tax=Clostridium beijerinckii TaxID=1520 RepID=A0AAE2UX94_CLOBE|nr:hypothetical protein [Clostridium beijerinckii]MBF7808255.1 hypothetical protein [Clostridium beijerinckii]NRT21823.1 hypothetical protein [Clostridium beijerinckii]NRT65671.1 hypothetical protein [Clostridium beijerinckii]NRT82816.1 hypothetical protein [Clostridium beijerinckii]NRU52762.1 hypothetical protein [Clostridium beijerinckii]
MDHSLLTSGMLLLACIVLKNNYVELEMNFSKNNKSFKIILQSKKSAV